MGENVDAGSFKSKVETVLENSIRPGLTMDDGNIELININEEEGVVMVRLTGACHGCPAAAMTLLYGVENILKKEIPEVKQVIAV